MRLWLEGAVDIVVSPLLLAELERVLACTKIRSRVSEAEAEAFLALLMEGATVVGDPAGPVSVHAADPNDDVVVALAEGSRAIIVSGDRHLLDMAGHVPVRSPTEFGRLVRTREGE